MITEKLNERDHLSSWEEARERFALILGTGREVPEAAVRRAIVDSTYAHRLMVSRTSSKFLDALLHDPANARYAPPSLEPAAPAPAPAAPVAEAAPASDTMPEEPSSWALLGKAAKALAAWGASGFSHADEPTYARRISACQGCPNLVVPKDLLVYRIAGAERQERSACGLCGCLVRNKARMASESCPGDHPEKPGFTRWDEPKRG